jgi:hypothetical protein
MEKGKKKEDFQLAPAGHPEFPDTASATAAVHLAISPSHRPFLNSISIFRIHENF